MKLSYLLKSVTTLTGSEDGISWYPIRPQTAENTFLIPRAKAAWRVLTGKSDAVEWDFPINKEQIWKDSGDFVPKYSVVPLIVKPGEEK